MDQVLGNEHTTNPPIIISPISNTPILEASRSPRTSTTDSTPSPVSQGDTEDGTDTPDPFSTGKRVKQKKKDALIELMMHGLEIKESEVEQRKRDRETEIEERKKAEEKAARSEEREQKLVDFMEILVKHIVRE